jgi:hypothetical protein
MRHRADTAKTLNGNWNLPVRTALYKPFKAAELNYMQTGSCNLPVLVEKNRHFAVPLHSGNRLYNDLAGVTQDVPPLYQSYLITS